MSWQMAIFTFINLWCIIFMMTLPFGISKPESYEKHHWPGAPDKPLLKKKAKITTVITAVIVAVAYGLINFVIPADAVIL